MDDPRVGQYTDNGIKWPVTDITGHAYERGTGAQAGIGDGLFVVLPVNYVDDGALVTLRLQHAPKPAKPKKEAGDDSISGTRK